MNNTDKISIFIYLKKTAPRPCNLTNPILFFFLTFGLTILAIAQPPNDIACSATLLTLGSGCSGFPYTNVDATAQVGEPNPACFVGNASNLETAWFKFVAPASGAVSINTSESTGIAQFQVQYAVYAVTDCNNFGTYTELQCHTSSFDQGGAVLGLTSGTTYYIQFDFTNGSERSFCIELAECLPATNDSPCSATALTLGASCTGFPYSNECSGADANEPYPNCFSGDASDLESVWFSFVAPSTNAVRIHIEDGSGINFSDLQIAVYISFLGNCAAYSTFVELDCISSPEREDYVLTGLSFGNTYYIQMDGAAKSDGNFCIEVEACQPVVNNNANGATALTLDAPCPSLYSNECASGQTNEPYPSCWTGDESNLNSLWFSFTAPPTGEVLIRRIEGSLLLGVLDFTVYTATNINDFGTYTEVACQAGGFSEYTSLSLTPNETYYIQVDGKDDWLGDFCLEVLSCPAINNDDACDAAPLTINADCTSNPYSNACAFSQTNEPQGNCFFGIPGSLHSVWFEFTATADGAFITSAISPLGSLNDNGLLQMALYSSTDCNDFNTYTNLACNRSDPSPTIDFSGLTPGETYFVQVDGEQENRGDFCLEIWAPEIICPPDQSVLCNLPVYADFTEFESAGGTAMSKNGLMANTFQLDSEVSDGMTCPETFTRTYAISDTKNFTATCTQVVTITDSQEPTLTCPPDLTLDCSTAPPSPYTILNFASAGGNIEDDCQATSGALQMLNQSGNLFACPGTLVRTYLFADQCGRTSTCTQTINIQDIGGCDGTDVTANDNPLPYEQYRASNKITSMGKVATGTSVEFKAGSFVNLLFGFEVELGGEFSVEIEGCDFQ